MRLPVAPEEARSNNGGGVVQGSSLSFQEAANDEDALLLGDPSPGSQCGAFGTSGVSHLLGEVESVLRREITARVCELGQDDQISGNSGGVEDRAYRTLEVGV